MQVNRQRLVGRPTTGQRLLHGGGLRGGAAGSAGVGDWRVPALPNKRFESTPLAYRASQLNATTRKQTTIVPSPVASPQQAGYKLAAVPVLNGLHHSYARFCRETITGTGWDRLAYG